MGLSHAFNNYVLATSFILLSAGGRNHLLISRLLPTPVHSATYWPPRTTDTLGPPRPFLFDFLSLKQLLDSSKALIGIFFSLNSICIFALLFRRQGGWCSSVRFSSSLPHI
ncbi:hypothetical protein GGS26DRAFT_325900 [Hypomontagnella submonticulosa]|nr:hypothetical protein GGS26DRAFT_325900 [Hypomontagnella submonticulosa]